VFRYITKPWDPEELVKALRQAGDRYDQIVDRNKLLADARQYEQRCMAYSDGLQAGKLGTLTDEGAAQAKQLLHDGRLLVERLDKAMEITVHDPMC
jgi:hypothetical protein